VKVPETPEVVPDEVPESPAVVPLSPDDVAPSSAPAPEAPSSAVLPEDSSVTEDPSPADAVAATAVERFRLVG